MKTLINLIILTGAVVHLSCTDAFGVEMTEAFTAEMVELCETELFADRDLSARIEQFSVYDTVFLEVRCELLVRDTYVISTQ